MATQLSEVSASLAQSLIDEVDDLALREHRTRDEVIADAMASWVALKNQRHEETLAALAEVDAGRTVSDEDMGAWVESLGTDMPLSPP